MATPTTEWFLFSSDACPDAGFHVVRFKGTEGLNQFFEFNITVVSTNPSIKLKKLLGDSACFTITRKNGTSAKFKGILSNAVQGGQFNGWTFYDVVLRPSFWMTTEYTFNGIFINKTLKDCFEDIYQQTDLQNFEHEYHLTQTYSPREFAMIYQETFSDYARWRLEEVGAYFYFATNEDKVIYADSPSSHSASQGKVFYSPQTGLDFSHREEVVTAFSCQCRHTPKNVVVRSYSWKSPDASLSGRQLFAPPVLVPSTCMTRARRPIRTPTRLPRYVLNSLFVNHARIQAKVPCRGCVRASFSHLPTITIRISTRIT